MSSTSNTQKNTFGKKRRRRQKPKSKTYRIAQAAAREEIFKTQKNQSEIKSYDITNVTPTITWTGHMEPITPPIVKGTEPYQRVGSEIYAKGILIRFHLQSSSPPHTWNKVRVMAIRWNASGTPTAVNILQFTGSGYAPLSPLVRDASHKFQILYDNLHLIGTECETSHMVDKIYLNKLGKCIWDDNSNPQKGHVYLLFISGSLTEVPNVQLSARVRYLDD